jgi:ParB/RepB/Spo0J family partition protein
MLLLMHLTNKISEIPIEKIQIGKSQARIRNVDKNIDVLAESIRRRGLLQPVVVCPKDDGYELIIGQRRYLAMKKLGHSSLPAVIVDKCDEMFQAKMDSITENEMREDMHLRDKIDLCTSLWFKYSSVRGISEELGWPVKLIVKYLKIQKLPKLLSDGVKDGKLKSEIALRIVDALYEEDDDIDSEKAYELTMELQLLNPTEREAIIEYIKTHSNQTVDEILENGKKMEPYSAVEIKLLKHDLKRIKQFARDQENDNISEVILDLTREGLIRYGY